MGRGVLQVKRGKGKKLMYCIQNCKRQHGAECHTIENCQHKHANPLELIANHYGLEHQKEKLSEELQELRIAIENPYSSRHDIITELADVMNMCEQMIIFLEAEEEIKNEREYKNKRQLERIAKEKEKKKNERKN